MNKLIIGPFAEEDLKNAKEYYELQKEGLGDELVEEVKNTIAKVVQKSFSISESEKGYEKSRCKRISIWSFLCI